MDTTKTLKVLQANTFNMFLKSWFFHWNVEGRDFMQLHDLFGQVYNDLFGAIDLIAEHIRALDDYAPGSLQRFRELGATIDDKTTIPQARAMVGELLADNRVVVKSLRDVVEAAKRENLEEIINFAGGRLETHTKFGWMLSAILKTDRE